MKSTNLSTNLFFSQSKSIFSGSRIVPAIVGIEVLNLANFRIQDINIFIPFAGNTTTVGKGNSLYGIRMETSSAFTLARMTIETGNAGSGENGPSGASGITSKLQH